METETDQTPLYQQATCLICGANITEAGMCSLVCDQDMTRTRYRKPGTVKIRTYQLTLVSEKIQ